MPIARSASEFLPAPFEAIGIEDVREILQRVGDTKETLFFERKVEASKRAIAKTCAAFANTLGGLLLVGVPNDSDELVGIDPVGEAQLWVKDVLRSHILPLPPFRARWIDLDDVPGKGLLLVLVEESSTTPHLLRSNGGIYVRSPSSSDPVPIDNQAALFDLTRRGREARDHAEQRSSLRAEWPIIQPLVYGLAMIPTGVRADPVQGLFAGTLPLDYVKQAVIADDTTNVAPTSIIQPAPQWSLNLVRLVRTVDRGFTADPERTVDAVTVEHDGAVSFHRAWQTHPGWSRGLDADEGGSRGPSTMQLEEDAVPWFSHTLARGKELLLELGAHGDLSILAFINLAGRNVFYAPSQASRARDNLLWGAWVHLEPDPARDAATIQELRLAARRVLGLQPSAPL